MSSYPKWLYHPSKEPTIVGDEAAHKALGPEWVESPADVKRPEPKAAAKPLNELFADRDEEKHPKKVK